MVLAKSKNAVGLGNSLMNDRFGRGKSNMHKSSAAQGSIKRKDQFGNEYVTNNKVDADWVKMRSITEQGALDEFLSTAELAGTDFTAEKTNNVKIIHTDQKNPYLLSKEEERGVVRKQNAKRARLTVPRRPPWTKEMSAEELDVKEREALLQWRRGLAELEEVDDLLMTPFERNLEVWRQLWRVVERSDLVVQIVDARNPLLYRCQDLEVYVKELDGGKKNNLLLVNKADMMTLEQRRVWTEWFTERGIAFRFFSAEIAKEMNQAREEEADKGKNAFDALLEDDDEESDEEEEESDEGELDKSDVEEEVDPDADVDKLAAEAHKIRVQDQQDDEDEWSDEEDVAEPYPIPEPSQNEMSIDEKCRILTTDDLEELFLQHSPTTPSGNPDADPSQRKTNIGLVGYPNVGKSSTINALLGAKKVSVSATPGKTKHFQTIHLSPKVLLCDCPGLVFPNFATTKAELVCAGVLPIDQLREYTGPGALVAQRIPQHFLEAIYGMRIITRPLEEGGTGQQTGEEVLRSYARARGFWTQGLGQPDEARASRSILKDYVKGKLLFCHPPPITPPADPKHFNRELYDSAHLPQKRRAHMAASDLASMAGTEDVSLMDAESDMPQPVGRKGASLDKAFFAAGQGGGNVARPFHYKYSEQGKELTGRKAKVMKALELDVDPADLRMSKKHNKANKKAMKKVRAPGTLAYDE